MSVELMQIVIESDGELAMVDIPKGSGPLLLSLISTVFANGVIKAIKLPSDIKMTPLSELIE